MALGHIRGMIAGQLYLKWDIDITCPVQVYGVINYTCNAKCLMCGCWREKKTDELPARDWIRALQSVKKTSGNFHVNFSGGEPFLKKDFFDILEFCSKEKIMAGLTTNGLLLNKKNIERVLRLNVTNINISIDSMDENIHDTIRGIPGLLRKVKSNIEYLVLEKERLKKDVQIIIKTIVGSLNINGLDNIVKYAGEMNLTGVNFQPVYKWTEESEEMLKVNSEVLSLAIDNLIALKKEGFNILNPVEAMRDWRYYFEGIAPKQYAPCTIALKNLTIYPNGDTYLCESRKAKIGNIKENDITKLWKSDLAKQFRKDLVQCKKTCTETCVVKRRWKDYFDLFLKFLKT